MKKKTMLIAALVICLAIAATGTLAYYTAEGKAHNVITSGGVNIEVVEKTTGEDGTLVDFPKDGIKGVMPGSSVTKIVRIDNKGSSEAWVRVKVDSKIVGADGKELSLVIGENERPVIKYTVLEGWIKGDDGYWYYNKPVAPGGQTAELFKSVDFDSAMGNEYQNCTANIVISAQAVQTANNGETVMEATGWPEE